MPTPLTTLDVVEIHVNGLQEGQTVTNVLSYLVRVQTGQVTIEDLLTSFRSNWRTIMALMNDTYGVVTYSAQRLSALVGLLNTPRLRYDAFAFLNGLPGPDSGTIAGPPLPTYVGAGLRKVTPGPQGISYLFGVPPILQRQTEKQFRGSMRLGAMSEADTLAGFGNRFTPAAITLIGDTVPFELLSTNLSSVGGTATKHLVVTSLTLDGAARTIASSLSAPYAVAYQEVTGMILNPLVSSQMSRKQTAVGA